MRISVCLASYNGARYIRGQLESILGQLGIEDELVVVDDGSTDDTVSVIQSFKDPRVRLHQNAVNLGVARTFDRALHLAQGDLIFLSDQDDRWHDNKVSVVRQLFLSQDVDLVVHDAVVVKEGNADRSSLFEMSKSSSGVIKNIISNTYTGCCMAFKKDILWKILPVPAKRGIFHDAWIGIMAECSGCKTIFIDIPLIDFNRHDCNVSTLKRRDISCIVPERINLILAITSHFIRQFSRNKLGKV